VTYGRAIAAWLQGYITDREFVFLAGQSALMHVLIRAGRL
jgi:hypothetical protein